MAAPVFAFAAAPSSSSSSIEKKEKKENSEKKDKKVNAAGEKKENALLLLSCPTERAHIYYTWKWLGEDVRHSNGGGEGVWREGVGGSPLLASVSLGV